jgi:hypothetical protein
VENPVLITRRNTGNASIEQFTRQTLPRRVPGVPHVDATIIVRFDQQTIRTLSVVPIPMRIRAGTETVENRAHMLILRNAETQLSAT